MREYGIKLQDGSGNEARIYFLPLTYGDWCSCVHPKTGQSKQDPAIARFLTGKYVTRAYRLVTNSITGTPEYEMIEPITIVDMMPGIVSNFVEEMFKKSGFGDEEKLLQMLSEAEEKSRSLTGSYDYFIFLHGGIELYKEALNADINLRAQIIMMLEKATGISVKKRFEDSIEFNIPLDLINETNKYDNKLRVDQKHGRLQPKQRQNSFPDHTFPNQQNDPVDLNNMVAASREALEQQLRAKAFKKEKKSFDWRADEAAISTFDRKQDKDTLSKVHKSKDPEQNPHLKGK